VNFYPTSRLRLFIGLAALFLFVGWAAVAQQPGGDRPGGDKSNEAIATAARAGVGLPACEYCPAPEYSKEARKKKYQGVIVLSVVVTTEGRATN